MKLYKKIKKFSMIIFCISMTILSSCSFYPEGRIDNIEGKVEVQVDSETKNAMGVLNESMIVDAKISVPSDVTWNAYTVKGREFTEEEANRIANYLSNGSDIIDYKVRQDHNGAMVYGIYFDNNSHVSIRSDGSMLFVTQEKQDRRFELYTLGGTNGLIRPDYKELYPLDELESYSKEEALKEVEALCQLMNIKTSETGQTIVVLDKINAEKVRQESSNVMMKGKVEIDKDKPYVEEEIPWTEENEVYYIQFLIDFEGVPCVSVSRNGDDRGTKQSSLTVIIGKKGVLYVDLDAYELIEQYETNIQVCDMSKALEALAADYHYAEGIGQNNKVDSIELRYAVVYDNDKRSDCLRPCWIFKIINTSKKIKEGKEYISNSIKVVYVDAQTGKTYAGGLK